MPPIPFLDALYCVGAGQRPLSGAAARALGCPAGGRGSGFVAAGRGSGFVAAHPGLFAASGFAHHPYSFFLAPGAPMSDPNFVPLSELGRLERALDAIFRTYAVRRKLPLYLTEYGYETNPPNPFRGVAPALQAAYLDQAAYLAWRDPRVRALSQFLLVDSPPDRAYRRGSFAYWSTFQTGLVYLGGTPKPALYTYALPIFVPAPTFDAGGAVTVWGMLRAARNGTVQTALVQWRAVRWGRLADAVGRHHARPDGRAAGAGGSAGVGRDALGVDPAGGGAAGLQPVGGRAPRRLALARPRAGASDHRRLPAAPARPGRRDPGSAQRGRGGQRSHQRQWRRHAGARGRRQRAEVRRRPRRARREGSGRACRDGPALAAHEPDARTLIAFWIAWVKSAKYCAP